MATSSRHVQKSPFKMPSEITQWWMDINLKAPGFELPWKVQNAKRRYPGEIEAAFVLAYIESLARFPAKRKSFVELLGPMRSGRDEAAEILRKVMATGNFAYDLKMGGFVLLPAEPKGIAALAILLLREQGRLERIRRCPFCSYWFYSRFSHQNFCSKKCQENSYHTPQWRKKNQQRNRKHQREYRERNFRR